MAIDPESALVGVGSGGFVMYLVKLLLERGLFRRLDALESKQELQASRQSDVSERLHLGTQSFGHQRELIDDLKKRIDALERRGK